MNHVSHASHLQSRLLTKIMTSLVSITLLPTNLSRSITFMSAIVTSSFAGFYDLSLKAEF